ncbi:Trp biosynthesis-associated membrane protein [Nocardioides panacisoli]|uniref:TIGR02234 family membrane protein n=1 Tax=Nocardioides panacisoli TaxID=627624 RepID=A0ABP7IN81_9ACTN
MADARARRTFVPTVLAGLAGAGLVALAGNKAWVSPSGDSANSAVTQLIEAAAGKSGSSASTAIALVLLASWGVVLVTRGRFRRVVAWFGAAVAIVLFVVVVAGWSVARQQLLDQYAPYSDTHPDTSWTVWAYLAALGAAVALAAGVLALRYVGGWPEMGSRYDAPTASAEDPSAPGQPVEEQSSIDIWKSLDEGEDPTA